MVKDELLNAIQRLIKTEMIKASEKFASFNTAHEGYAILLEEVDELWAAIKLKQSDVNRDTHITHEALHVAAMALRFLYDICSKDEAK